MLNFLRPKIKSNFETDDVSYTFYRQNLSRKLRADKLYILGWTKFDGDFVKEGELICIIESYMHYNPSYEIYAQTNGNIEIFKCADKILDGFNPGDPCYLTDDILLYKIYKNIKDEKKENLLKQKYLNIPIITQDDFTKNTLVKWKVVGNNHFHNNMINETLNVNFTYPDNNIAYLTINYLDNNNILIFRHLKKEYFLEPNDHIKIIFENNEILNLNISEKSYFLYKYGNDKIYENRITIYHNDLLKLKDNYIKDIRITFSDKRIIEKIEPLDKDYHNYRTNKELTEAFHLLFNEYFEIISSIEDYNAIEYCETVKEKRIELNDECYIYLMKDISNGFYKIGISNKPEYREKTLQSEKPTIEMVNNKKFAKRKIALSIEKSLHQTYSEQRIRGEWFNLTDDDVNDILSVMN